MMPPQSNDSANENNTDADDRACARRLWINGTSWAKQHLSLNLCGTARGSRRPYCGGHDMCLPLTFIGYAVVVFFSDSKTRSAFRRALLLICSQCVTTVPAIRCRAVPLIVNFTGTLMSLISPGSNRHCRSAFSAASSKTLLPVLLMSWIESTRPSFATTTFQTPLPCILFCLASSG